MYIFSSSSHLPSFTEIPSTVNARPLDYRGQDMSTFNGKAENLLFSGIRVVKGKRKPLSLVGVR